MELPALQPRPRQRHLEQVPRDVPVPDDPVRELHEPRKEPEEYQERVDAPPPFPSPGGHGGAGAGAGRCGGGAGAGAVRGRRVDAEHLPHWEEEHDVPAGLESKREHLSPLFHHRRPSAPRPAPFPYSPDPHPRTEPPGPRGHLGRDLRWLPLSFRSRVPSPPPALFKRAHLLLSS